VAPDGRRFRFAPTPSHALHPGNAVAAVIGWAAARAVGGTFVVRIEDIDQARSRDEHIEGALDTMEWLGLDWDEGPRVGGDLGPYRQSERLDLYDALLGDLAARGATYGCTCSRADIRSAQSAPHLEAGGEVPYPGTCRPGGDEATQELLGDRGGYRLDVTGLGEGAVVSWTDPWQGPQSEDVRSTCGDVLLGRPGHPTYQLAVVCDDIAMGITDVVRGDDLLGSTPRQILLHRVLGAAPPRFAHHPLILGEDGRKLSKRSSDPAVDAYRLAGGSPSRLLASLAHVIGLVPETQVELEARDWIDLLAPTQPAWRPGTLAGQLL
jgi:glutamyl-tRNA synthetase